MEENSEVLQRLAEWAEKMRHLKEICNIQRKYIASKYNVESSETQDNWGTKAQSTSAREENVNDASSTDATFAYSEVAHQVATIELVLIHIFEFLDVGTLKHCREVCKLWRKVCQPTYANRAKLGFFMNGGSPAQYVKTFQREAFPCHHVKFDTATYIAVEVQRLLQVNASQLQSLELDNITVCNESGKVYEKICFNLDIRLNSLRKLEITCYGETQFIVHLKFLFLEDLKLSNCRLVCNNEKKLSPKNLEFNFVNYFTDTDEKMEIVDLNDFVDFTNIKDIIVNKNMSTSRIQLNLEMYKDISINSIELSHVHLSINRAIKVKHLKIACVNNFDLACLPDSLEVFHFEKSQLSYGGTNMVALLPNLKCFFWDIFHIPSFYPDLSLCTNLTDVKIINFFGVNVQLNLSLLPVTVKKLIIDKGVTIKEKWSADVHLESLCLLDHNWETISDIVNCLIFDHLTINLKQPEGKNNLNENFDLFKDILRKAVGSVIIGKFNWNTTTQFNEQMFTVVDKMEDYYCFKDGRGKAMILEDFNKHLEFLGYKKDDYYRLYNQLSTV